MLTTSQIVCLDTTAVTGALNWGEFAIRYRKFQKQIRWRDGPSIAYCTEAGGSFVDDLGATWAVSSCGLVERDRLLDRKTSGVLILLQMPDGDIYHQSYDKLWHRRDHDRWVGQLMPPWQSPGILIPNLAPGTAYEIVSLWTNSKGAGPPSQPIVVVTDDPRARRLAIEIETDTLTEDVIQCQIS